MFADRRGRGPGYHRWPGASSRTDGAERVRTAGFALRPAKNLGSRFETSRKSYPEALAIARSFGLAGEVDIRRRMAIGAVVYDLLPVSHLHPGMTVLTRDGDRLLEAIGADVAIEPYDGPVYDLEVDVNHSYVADGVLVHNSIYKWRGADMRNILEFERVFPDVTTILLEQNYRSTQTILDAANAVIENNASRKPKQLWTEAGRGDRILRYQAHREADESQC